MNNQLKPQSRLRKDSIVAEFYHQSKLAGFNVILAYRDYDICDHTIEGVIHTDMNRIICFVRIRNNTRIRGIIPVYDIKSMNDIPNIITLIEKLTQ